MHPDNSMWPHWRGRFASLGFPHIQPNPHQWMLRCFFSLVVWISHVKLGQRPTRHIMWMRIPNVFFYRNRATIPNVFFIEIEPSLGVVVHFLWLLVCSNWHKGAMCELWYLPRCQLWCLIVLDIKWFFSCFIRDPCEQRHVGISGLEFHKSLIQLVGAGVP